MDNSGTTEFDLDDATVGAVCQSDLDVWAAVPPVNALNTDSLFLTMSLECSLSDDGIEIRNYFNETNRIVCPTAGLGGNRCLTDATTHPKGFWE